MEGTAFSIDEASLDALLLPEGSRTPGTEPFHRAVTDYFQRAYASMGGQLSVLFTAGRIEVAWEPAPPEPAPPEPAGPEPAGPEPAGPEPAGPEAPAMATIGPLLQQRRFDEARPLLPDEGSGLGLRAGDRGGVRAGGAVVWGRTYRTQKLCTQCIALSRLPLCPQMPVAAGFRHVWAAVASDASSWG